MQKQSLHFFNSQSVDNNKRITTEKIDTKYANYLRMMKYEVILNNFYFRCNNILFSLK